MTISARANSFDALRIVAALLVVIGHSTVLLGLGRVPRVLGISIDQLGVYIFFAISGYLITVSWRSHPALAPFLAKRALRIFPALVVVVVVTVFLLGPIATTLPLADYFGTSETWMYLTSVSLIPQYLLPGVFEVGHHVAAVNGSLWTLGIEFSCYLAVAVAGLALRRWAALGSLALAAVGIALVVTPAQNFGRTAVFFAVGSLLSYVVTRKLFAPGYLLLALPLWGVAATLWPSASLPLAWLFLPLVTLGLGLMSIPGVRHCARFGDPSYGMYLWGFPIQQLSIMWAPGLPQAASLAIVIPATAALGYASWHLVEKRALALKPHRVTVATAHSTA